MFSWESNVGANLVFALLLFLLVGFIKTNRQLLEGELHSIAQTTKSPRNTIARAF